MIYVDKSQDRASLLTSSFHLFALHICIYN